MVQGQVFLNRGADTFPLFLFNFFKVYHFYIHKLLYPLQNCVMFFVNFLINFNEVLSIRKLPSTDSEVSLSSSFFLSLTKPG